MIKTVLHPRSHWRCWYGSGSVSKKYGSEDPDPYQNIEDPEHCKRVKIPISKSKPSAKRKNIGTKNKARQLWNTPEPWHFPGDPGVIPSNECYCSRSGWIRIWNNSYIPKRIFFQILPLWYKICTVQAIMANLSLTRFITYKTARQPRDKKLGGKGPQTDKQLSQIHFAGYI